MSRFKRPDLTIVMAVWDRPELTRRVMEYYSRFFVRRIAVCTAGDDYPIVDGWEYVFALNEPLGRKWNTGIKAAVGSELVMIVGSDDLVTGEHISRCWSKWNSSGVDFVQARGAHIYTGGHSVFHVPDIRPGPGRCLSKRLLDMLDWQPFSPIANDFLDSSLTSRLRKLEIKKAHLREDAVSVVDIKTSGHNMWSFKRVHEDTATLTRGKEVLKLRNIKEIPAASFFAHHFPGFDYAK